jgi:hypothetical protein
VIINFIIINSKILLPNYDLLFSLYYCFFDPNFLLLNYYCIFPNLLKMLVSGLLKMLHAYFCKLKNHLNYSFNYPLFFSTVIPLFQYYINCFPKTNCFEKAFHFSINFLNNYNNHFWSLKQNYFALSTLSITRVNLYYCYYY